ncbi:MAG: DUF484 family protein [Oleiphilaceae bacterium]|nr:DUF484 family protein [Oleiphilaceae bacterium]
MTESAVSSVAQQVAELSDEQVVAYLRQHPDFFVEHEYLLREIRFPHKSGNAISLGERQVQVFREDRDDLKNRLETLIKVARDNDAHFEKSKRLLLNLLEIKSLDEVQYVVSESFKDDPKIDFTSVVVFGEREEYPVADVSLLNVSTARDVLGSLIDSTNAVCGQFTAAQLQSLFPNDHDQVGSAALIPLRNGETLGMFCLASKDSQHFDSSMGSLFLSYISDFISRILPSLLIKARSKRSEDQVPSLLD